MWSLLGNSSVNTLPQLVNKRSAAAATAATITTANQFCISSFSLWQAVTMKVEETPSFEAVTKQRPMKTEQIEQNFCVTIIYRVCRLGRVVCSHK